MVVGEILSGISEIFISMFQDLSLLWLILPTIGLWILSEIYPSDKKHLSMINGISILWIGIILTRELFDNRPESFAIKLAIAIILSAYGLLVLCEGLAGKLPEYISYLTSSPTILYFSVIIIILWTFGQLEFTRWILIAYLILTAIFYSLFFVFRKISGREGGGEDFGGGSPTDMPELGKDFSMGATASPGMPEI